MKGESARKHRLHRAVILTTMLALVTAVSLAVHGSARFPGDANVDKTIDVSDAVLVARYYVGDAVMITKAGIENADANSDDNVDEKDVLLIVRQIAGFASMPEYSEDDPAQTTAAPTETTAAAAETTVPADETSADPASETTISAPSVTTAAVTTTAADTSSEQPGLQTKPSGQELTVDSVPYPLGVSISVLTGKTRPNEMLTVSYESGNVIFAIFADDPKNMTIAIAYEDNIVGYYKFCKECTIPDGYDARLYTDTLNGGDKLYAVLVLREDFSIDFQNLRDKNDFMVLSKLNFYGTNGVRAMHDMPLCIWDPELAKIAQQHSIDMAERNYHDHTTPEGQTYVDRIVAHYGDEWAAYGENVDWGYQNPFDALNGWYNSANHRETILNADLLRMGVGFAYSPDAKDYYRGTQDFLTLFDD